MGKNYKQGLRKVSKRHLQERPALAEHVAERRSYRATVVRFGEKPGWCSAVEKTILLSDVIDVADDALAADHLWMNCGKGFSSLDLNEGELVEFDARVTTYVAGYRGWNSDRAAENPERVQLGLERPTRIRRAS